MSAGLEQYDWMVSVRKRPWHGIGSVVEDAPTSEDAIRMAKLDWTVEQVPVTAEGKVIQGAFANMRSDTKMPLGLVRGRYKVVQNLQAFDFVDDIIQNSTGVKCKYETAGSLFNGRKIFLTVKLQDKKILGDSIENYLFFTNSHDGYSSLTAGISNVRVVCNNTLQLAQQNAKRVWRCRHTQSIIGKRKLAQETLGLAIDYVDNLDKIANDLVSKKVGEKHFLDTLLKCNPAICDKSRDKIKERLHIIYTQKDDLENFKGTAWGLYNAVADYVSNAQPLRTTQSSKDRKLDLFFSGYGMLQNAQDILMAA